MEVSSAFFNVASIITSGTRASFWSVLRLLIIFPCICPWTQLAIKNIHKIGKKSIDR